MVKSNAKRYSAFFGMSTVFDALQRRKTNSQTDDASVKIIIQSFEQLKMHSGQFQQLIDQLFLYM